MKILLILPRPLFPTDTGGKIRTLKIFEQLARRAEIHAISLADATRDGDNIAAMRRVFASYTPVFWRETPQFSPAFYAEFLRSRFGRLPYFLAKYARPEFRRAVEGLHARQGFDLVLCDFLQSAVVMLDSPLRPRVIFEHNVEYVIRKRHWERETNPLRKWLLHAEWQKARTAEAEVCRTFDHVIAVSEDDRRIFEQEFGARHVTALPTGVDADYFRPGANGAVEPKRGNLVFVGSMDWHPNEEGIAWFVREVYPRVRAAAPHASLTVVGRKPSPAVQALAQSDSSIEITGTVSDVRPYLERAEVVVVPLRIGGGTRIKIFEAMAMGRPVVSTTLGAEGLPLEHGREILLENQPERLAQAVTDLLGDPARRAALARAAREKVTRDYTWSAVAGLMHVALTRAAGLGMETPEPDPRCAEGLYLAK